MRPRRVLSPLSGFHQSDGAGTNLFLVESPWSSRMPTAFRRRCVDLQEAS